MASTEKVIARPRGAAVRDHRDGVHLDQPLGPGQGGDDEPGRDRVHAAGPAADRAVDRLAVARVDEVDRQLDQVLHPAAGLLEQQVDVGHGALRLRLDVADADGLAGVEVLADLAAYVDGVAGDDRLAEVVVEVLLRVGLLGVERPDAEVSARRDALAVHR